MKISDLIAAGKAYAAATRDEVVDVAEANRRASICQSGFNGKPCPHLKPSDQFKNKASATLGRLSGEHNVPKIIADRSCGVCGCSMLLLLPALPANVHKDSPEEHKRRPSFCWVRALNK